MRVRMRIYMRVYALPFIERIKWFADTKDNEDRLCPDGSACRTVLNARSWINALLVWCRVAASRDQ